MLILLVEIAAVAYVGLVAVLYLGQRHLLFHPDRRRPVLGALADLGVREITFETADGITLSSWYLTPRGSRPVVLYCHGNGGHIGYRCERLLRFAREGYGVLFLEYRGYGGNPGFPCERGLCADAAAALDFLVREAVPPQRIALYGESLGSGVAVQLASRREVGAMILEAPFTSVAAAAQCHYPFVPCRLLVRDRFASLAAIARVAAPKLILHGERDRVVPIRFGRALYEAAPEPKEAWFAPQAGHGDLAAFGALDAAIAFLKRHLG
ncbi:MAG TPA: alpha/beta hydrolase [Stellaceae bacterium]|nr:alpha/beta hydrolase [Stellaceae bacterium]